MNHQRKSALAEFFSCNYNRLVSYVRGMIDDSAHRSSDDIVQDVILKILERPDVVAPISDLSAYVFCALRNRLLAGRGQGELQIMDAQGKRYGT